MDIRYTAGLFDGEGGIRIGKSRQTGSSNWHYSLVVYLQMTHKDTILNLQKDWGGSIRPYKKPKTNWKDQWQWTICSNRAILFLKSISPWVVIKKPQFELALVFQGLLHPSCPKGYNIKLTLNELSQREKCFQEMKQLNKRGK